jgi:hypothetical protein
MKRLSGDGARKIAIACKQGYGEEVVYGESLCTVDCDDGSGRTTKIRVAVHLKPGTGKKWHGGFAK